MDIMEMLEVLGIIFLCIIGLSIILLGAGMAIRLSEIRHKPKTHGYLHVRSDEDGPYLFLEPSIPIEDICNRDTVTLTVIHK